ncbi:MAG: molybdopterin molybdotransferase MoeA [Armatimonadetes bacterium]|nr:molybdopterin molybdotransferase MoeA [Armatimonadota bacterium]
MLSVIEAQERILRAVAPLAVEMVSLQFALGRILAKDSVCPLDLPPFNNSGMDGYAVLAEDTVGASEANPVKLKVLGTVAAGDWWIDPLRAGQALRIMTGALIPPGADAVVMVEKTRPSADIVEILQQAKSGQNIRPKGEDVPQGKTVIREGTRLRAAEVGLLASMGFASVPVHGQPRVAVISTGDELVEVDQPLPPGKIRDSNSYAVGAATQRAGALLHSRHHVEDDPEALRSCLESLLPQVDMILTTGGVSVGDFDVVKAVVGDLGDINFWKVAMKPGKPLVFADLRGKPMFGLPGNPVSSLVTFELFVRPTLLKMQGTRNLQRPAVTTMVMQECRSSEQREEFVRARTIYENGQYQSRLCGDQGSGRLSSLVEANSLLVIPAEVTRVPAGALVTAIMTDWEE